MLQIVISRAVLGAFIGKQEPSSLFLLSIGPIIFPSTLASSVGLPPTSNPNEHRNDVPGVKTFHPRWLPREVYSNDAGSSLFE